MRSKQGLKKSCNHSHQSMSGISECLNDCAIFLKFNRTARTGLPWQLLVIGRSQLPCHSWLYHLPHDITSCIFHTQTILFPCFPWDLFWLVTSRMAPTHPLPTTNLDSSKKHVMSGTIPPSQCFKIPSPTRSFNNSAGSLDPPCCNTFVRRAVPAVNESGSSWHNFFHMVAAKHFAYK